MLFCLNVKGQKVVNLDTIDNTVYLGKFKLKTPSFFKSKYTYDPLIDKYIYTTKNGEIDVGVPLILTPQEYRERVKEESIKSYFSEKIDLLKTSKSEEIGFMILISFSSFENCLSIFESVNDQVTDSRYPFDARDR